MAFLCPVGVGRGRLGLGLGLWCAVAAALLVCDLTAVEAKKRSRGQLPIDDPDELVQQEQFESNGEKRKASECRFGDKRYELEQTWNPDLGPPFGVMACIHCECVPNYKKRRIVGRVKCKNIRSECPKPDCAEPQLLPGRCCKVCSGQTNNPDLNITVDLAREDEEKNGRHFGSLLVQDNPVQFYRQLSATGRFAMKKKSLSYSFVVSPDFGWPKLLTFMDSERNIVEEFPLMTTPLQSTSGKVCGTWSRVPHSYRRQLRRDELWAQLTNANGDSVTGRVAKHFGLTSELFSGLLLAEKGGPGAATVIMSVSYSTGSVHFMILASKDVFGSGEGKDAVAKVFLEIASPGERRTVEEKIDIPKISGEGSTAFDFKTILDPDQLSALGNGKLKMTVASKATPILSVSGFLVPKFSCDLFDCVMSTSQVEDAATPTAAAAADSESASGIAWLLTNRDGSIKYSVRLDDIALSHLPVTSIQIDNGRKSKRLFRVVHDLTTDVSVSLNVSQGVASVWANGSLRMNVSDLDELFKGNLFVHAILDDGRVEIRGSVMPQSISEAHDLVRPILLKGQDTGVTGIAWANVDEGCALTYQARLTGSDPKTEHQLLLVDYPIKSSGNLAMMPARRTKLQSFRGSQTDGSFDNIHKLTLARLDAGDASIVIKTGDDDAGPRYELEGRILGSAMPSECLPRYARTQLEMMPGFLSDLGEERPEVERELATRCLYEGSVYEDGAQWEASHKKCQMCSCHRGTVVCDAVVCPKLECSQPVLLEGDCCGTCDADPMLDAEDGSTRRGCVLDGDKKFRAAGSLWHPYIPPFGFSQCVTCTCQADTLQIVCKPKQCPVLTCPLDMQERLEPGACCKQCKTPLLPPEPVLSVSASAANPEQPQDMAEEWTDDDVLNDGGCRFRDEVFENGALWHPRVEPHGEMKCVNCRCKDGVAKCKRQECPVLDCKYKMDDEFSCCQRCAETKAEIKRAKKLKRIMKIRKERRLRKLRKQKPEE